MLCSSKESSRSHKCHSNLHECKGHFKNCRKSLHLIAPKLRYFLRSLRVHDFSNRRPKIASSLLRTENVLRFECCDGTSLAITIAICEFPVKSHSGCGISRVKVMENSWRSDLSVLIAPKISQAEHVPQGQLNGSAMEEIMRFRLRKSLEVMCSRSWAQGVLRPNWHPTLSGLLGEIVSNHRYRFMLQAASELV